MTGILHQIHRRLGNAHRAKTGLQSLYNGTGTAEGFLAAPENADVAAFQRQGCRVTGNIGPALIDDGNDAHGNRDLIDPKAIRAGVAFQKKAHRIGKLGNLPDALCHSRNPLRGQAQTIQHHIGYMPPCRLQILFIGEKNLLRFRKKAVRHGMKRPVLLLFG